LIWGVDTLEDDAVIWGRWEEAEFDIGACEEADAADFGFLSERALLAHITGILVGRGSAVGG
jgi:hypothetical protein